MTLRRTTAPAALLLLATGLPATGLLAGCASYAEIPLHPAVPAALDRAESARTPLSAASAPPGNRPESTPPRATLPVSTPAESALPESTPPGAALPGPTLPGPTLPDPALPELTSGATVPRTPVDTDRQRPTDGVLLGAKRDVPVHAEPGGPAFARLPAHQFRTPTWVPMIERRGDWARVLLPSRPNGSAGWINAGDATAVKAAVTPYRVDVDVTARRLAVREGEREIGSWPAGVGTDRSPTPRGRTFLLAVHTRPGGPAALALGAHSEVPNGPGTIELRGEPDPKAFGAAGSDGSVQVSADALQVLRRLPLGTPVLIR